MGTGCANDKLVWPCGSKLVEKGACAEDGEAQCGHKELTTADVLRVWAGSRLQHSARRRLMNRYKVDPCVDAVFLCVTGIAVDLSQVLKTLGDGCATQSACTGMSCLPSSYSPLFHARVFQIHRTYGSVLKAQNKQTNEWVRWFLVLLKSFRCSVTPLYSTLAGGNQENEAEVLQRLP